MSILHAQTTGSSAGVRMAGCKKKMLIFLLFFFAALLAFKPTGKVYASATTLVAPLAAEAAQISNLITQFNNMVEAWDAALADLLGEVGFSVGDIIEVRAGFYETRSNEQYYSEDTSLTLMMPRESGVTPRDHQRRQIGFLQNDQGHLDRQRMERILPPPHPSSDGNLDDEVMSDIRKHSRLITQETFIEPAPRHLDDTVIGTEYELNRISYIQQQLLAQDSVKQYPLHASILKTQSDISIMLAAAAEDESVNAATLLGLQVMAASELNGQTNIHILESSLRQERILGALLSIKARDHYTQEIDNLSAQGGF